jgi:hypothetical protein
MGDVIDAKVGGDGMDAGLSAGLVTTLKADVDQVVHDAEMLLVSGQLDAERTRLCVWDGQSPDGRKWAGDDQQEPPMPFDGACDARVRLTDAVVNEMVALCFVASVRAMLTVRPMGGQDSAFAGKMQKLHRWVMRNVLGYRWARELLKALNWYFGDSPALALMKVYWRDEVLLQVRSVGVDELAALFVERRLRAEAEAGGMPDEGMVVEAVEDFKAALLAPDVGLDVAADVVMVEFPFVTAARARRMVADLRKSGVAEFPMPVTQAVGPQVVAERFLRHFFMPIETTDFQRARVWFEPEWLTKAEVLDRARSQSWAPEFVKALVGGGDAKGLEGEFAFPGWYRTMDDDGVHRVERFGKERYKGMYQVVTAYFLGVNADGVLGRYFVVFHPQVEKPATGRKLLRYAHGLYPGHLFVRECITERPIDSRGLPELMGPHQELLKLFVDSFGDNAQVAALPPVITRNRRTLGRLYLAPLQELQAKRDGDYAFMTPPQYPQTVPGMMDELRRQVDEYAGRENAKVSPQLVAVLREQWTTWWLEQLREVHKQVLQLCQEYMPPEMLGRVTDEQGQPLAMTPEDIQGQFDIELRFDTRDMDLEYLQIKGNILRDIILALDRGQTVQTGPVVRALLWSLAPEIADVSLRDEDKATLDEVQDELKAYMEIRAGREPERDASGRQNYGARLQMYRELEAANPAVFGDMAPDKVAILQARLQHFEAMSQQFGSNVQIGREGARRATGQGGGGQRTDDGGRRTEGGGRTGEGGGGEV